MVGDGIDMEVVKPRAQSSVVMSSGLSARELCVFRRELEKKIATTKSDLNQMSQQLQMGENHLYVLWTINLTQFIENDGEKRKATFNGFSRSSEGRALKVMFKFSIRLFES